LIDLHSHILFGLDDGPPDIEGSVAMARVAVANGIHTIAATPHVREDYRYDLAEIASRTAALDERLRRERVKLDVICGAEVALTEISERDDRSLERLCLGTGRTLLLESPYTHAPQLIERVLAEVQSRGFGVLLAHPERSPAFLEDLRRLERLAGGGVLVSITAGSMAGRFGKPVFELTRSLFERGLVDNVASDAHDALRRPPDISGGFRSLDSDLPGLLEQQQWFTEDAAAAIASGEELPLRPTPPRRRRRGFGRGSGR
jgi:protein-tyrosine phosphatase